MKYHDEEFEDGEVNGFVHFQCWCANPNDSIFTMIFFFFYFIAIR